MEGFCGQIFALALLAAVMGCSVSDDLADHLPSGLEDDTIGKTYAHRDIGLCATAVYTVSHDFAEKVDTKGVTFLDSLDTAPIQDIGGLTAWQTGALSQWKAKGYPSRYSLDERARNVWEANRQHCFPEGSRLAKQWDFSRYYTAENVLFRTTAGVLTFYDPQGPAFIVMVHR